MPSKFITNQERLLSNVINHIIPESEGIYFLVGYFYFSGFFKLHQKLKDKKVKILVGLDVERELSNKLKEFYLLEQGIGRKSIKAIKTEYFKSLVDLINETNFCDTGDRQNGFRIFLEKINDGTLELKKTSEPNHAKLYIFESAIEHSRGGELPGTVITGSSNLTLSGLENRFEINVISHEAADYETSKKIFDDLWQTANPLINQDNLAEFMEDVVEKIWIDKLPKPYLVYVKILSELLSIPDKDIKYPSEITKNNFFDLEYQKDAIKKSLDILEKHNGVIVADVVGLGKSIIASTVAYNLGMQTIVICPPHLQKQWQDYKRMFYFNADVYPSGSIHKVLADYEKIEGKKLIIVDEAHKYRNELTEDYNNLHRLCSNNKTLLLSATPFNNKPQDIFSMIKLFQIPARSTIRTVDNLSNKFKELVVQYKKLKDIKKEEERMPEIRKIADQIRDLLHPLLIRRSRIDLDRIPRYKEDLQKQGIEFPEVNPPKLLDYNLGNVEDKYSQTLGKIMGDKDNEENGFIGARYKPTKYIKPEKREKYDKEIEKMYGDRNLFKQSQSNIAKFMKRLLVHRFESSVYAFYSTLESMLKSMRLVNGWYEKLGKVPVYKKGDILDPESLFDTTSDQENEQITSLDQTLDELKENKGYWYIDKKDLEDKFIELLKKDIALLEEIKKDWFLNIPFGFELGADAKIDEFQKELAGQLKKYPDRKIVVFSSYSDTANYVYHKLKKDFKVFKYSSADANEKNKETIKKNFDAGLPAAEQANDYEVLMATDAISEGVNLHRAGTIINFDIPYNPTRVIQRVGRINRINKKVFDELFIYNYFPSFIGESETRVKHISTLKIQMINTLLGSDVKVLTEDEDIESFYQDEFKKAEFDENRESWDTPYRRELEKVEQEILDKAEELPKRTRISRTIKKDRQGVLIFAKKGNDYLFKLAEGDECLLLGAAEALKLFQAEIIEKAQVVSDDFEPIYQKLLANLFKQTTATKLDNTDRNTIEKISALINLYPEDKGYLDDLMYVMRDLESLTKEDAKYLRNIKIDKNKKDRQIMTELKQQISHSYLAGIIKKASEIEEGRESLIITEELN